MPHALIVDDSKTARYALRLLLDKQQITSDMVESAEQALEYLSRQAPDLIFMDHMMPGMDGFQAVKAIKSNAHTAHIPIVMYTSTQGGVYFGQARALGAADVIAKPASAEQLTQVLQRLEEQRQTSSTAAAAQPAAAPVMTRDALTAEAPAAATAATPPPAAPVTALPPAGSSRRASAWLTGLGIALLIATTLLLYTLVQRSQLLAQRDTAFKTIEWAFNLSQTFPYGEPPFGGARLERLQTLVQQLDDAGFRGTIRLESHVGEFCLLKLPNAGDGPSGWTVAPPELHLTDCTTLGQSAEQSQQLSAGESAAFRRYLRELPRGIRIQTVPLGATEPREPYPTDPDVGAGEWNRIAQQNQSVQIVLQPSDNL